MKLSASPVRRSPVDSLCQRTILIAVRELSATLVDLLAGLATISDGDGFWLRPLAAVSVELEFLVQRGSSTNLLAVGSACRDLLELLAAPPQVNGFAARYVRARQSLPELQALHDRAQLDCRRALGAWPAEGGVVQVPDPPCDFGAFVAERRGIARGESDALIARWLATYEPRSRVAGALPTTAPLIAEKGGNRECIGQSLVSAVSFGAA